MLTPCQAVQAEIDKYSWDHHVMMAIAQAENSTCNPHMPNETAGETHRRADGSIICIGSYSVLQVACSSYSAGEDKDSLQLNVKKAYEIWTSRNVWGNGYQAWSTYNNGAYIAHM